MNTLRVVSSLIKPRSTAILTKRWAAQPNKPKDEPPPVLPLKIIKGIHEPEYLDLLKPQVPFYELINVQVKGYDFVVLDEYAKYIRNLSKRIGLTVNDYWATPHKAIKLETIKAQTQAAVEKTYLLNLYERNIQIKHMKAKFLSIYLEILQASKPPGVQLNMHEHLPEHKEIRYIPDLQLAQMKEELEEWKQPISIIAETKKRI